MTNDGIVSIWVGKTDSEKTLDDYVEMRYNRDGDSRPSKFMRDFKIKEYDEDYLESEYTGKPAESLSELLDGFSYCEEIVSAYAEKFPKARFDKKSNSAILIYNFQYKGLVDSTDDDDDEDDELSFTFIGTVKYE